jgi:hypothetical protein
MKQCFQFILIVLILLIAYMFMKSNFVYIATALLGLYVTTKSDLLKESFQSPMKNIYGEPLQPCRKLTNDMSGSWDDKGLCSELGGGVHQICFDVTNQTKNFATDTYQGMNWSKDRLGKNHCMCLGAWALYKSRQKQNQLPKTSNELKCEAIPEVSLTKGYIDTWNSWNGNELPNQVVDGVNDLVKQCYQKAKTNQQKQYLKQTYNKLIRGRNEFLKPII